MARAVTHCPKCRTRVTPYAAGCAVCGADLDAARARRSARPGIALPSVHLPSAGGGRLDAAQIVVALLVAITFSPAGFILAIYWATRYYREGNTPMTVIMCAAGALAAAAIFAPISVWGAIVHI